ncbi:hypothetical protein [Fulvivirga ligni]|uniref:hypothetical protein n=1 Tax=Fulvivirga ligni TaxID=2904246 RepID=UPI001F16E6F7|nr:hypothetical protein [Fulvivirga ligni]UII20172.1 hypothetical protein LVD16_20205 [Fulvivirga ligni]
MNKKVIIITLLLLASAINAFSLSHQGTIPDVERIFLNTDREGYVAGELIWFKAYTLDKNNIPNDLSKVLYIELIDSVGNSVIQSKHKIDNGFGSGNIYVPSSIQTGRYLMVCYTSLMRNFDHKIYFQKSISIINSHVKVPNVNIANDSKNPVNAPLSSFSSTNNLVDLQVRKKSFPSRALVKVSLQNKSKDIMSNISISVFQADSLNLIENLKLENVQSYSSDQKMVFLPELEGHISYFNSTDNQGITAPVYLSMLSTSPEIYSTTLKEDGSAMFITQKVYGNHKMIIQAIDNSIKFEQISPFYGSDSSFRQPTLKVPPSFKNTIERRSIYTQVQNVYSKDSIFLQENAEIKDAFYGVPDHVYWLDNYTRFPTMEEVLREYVEQVQVRKKGDIYSLHVWDNSHQHFFESNPIVLFNGIPITSMNEVMKIDPLKIQSIEIITSQYIMSPQVWWAGIVSLKSYPDYQNETLIAESQSVIEFNGLSPELKFYSPDYSTNNNKRIPDFRNLLYWEPTVILEAQKAKEISFYTSDIKGKYIIKIEGWTSNGQFIQAEETFEVK